MAAKEVYDGDTKYTPAREVCDFRLLKWMDRFENATRIRSESPSVSSFSFINGYVDDFRMSDYHYIHFDEGKRGFEDNPVFVFTCSSIQNAQSYVEIFVQNSHVVNCFPNSGYAGIVMNSQDRFDDIYSWMVRGNLKMTSCNENGCVKREPRLGKREMIMGRKCKNGQDPLCQEWSDERRDNTYAVIARTESMCIWPAGIGSWDSIVPNTRKLDAN
jgi:hypothetical protein